MLLRFPGARILVSLVGVAGVLAGSLSAQPAVTVVMSGLDNPRSLAFGPEGALYVAESGRGGTGPCGTNSPGEPVCYGPSGAITRLWRGEQERIVSGLPSLGNMNSTAANGPNGISFQGRGGLYVTIGFGNNPALRSTFGPAGALLGTLLHVSASGEWRVIADISAYESAMNPAGGPIDSNPFGALAVPGARVVTDAGGNSLLRIAATGDISTIAVFPSRPGRSTDAVPTAVEIGPDGAYYISELSGVPFAPGAARIYRVEPGSPPEVYLTGFTTAIDLAFGPDGSLYVLQHSTLAPFFGGPGELVRVAPDGTRSTVLGGLDRPTSVAIDSDGTIYVTNHGVSRGIGEVLRIEQ
jgi:hypothetical protein